MNNKVLIYDDGCFVSEMNLSQCVGVHLPKNKQSGCAILPDGRYILIHKEAGMYHGIIYQSGELVYHVVNDGMVEVMNDSAYSEINELLDTKMSIKDFIMYGVPDIEDLRAEYL
ncbi:hypothetical protein KL86SPO_50225 [uncultured Sporomusa sp.]|uniref:Uncharacterized protein n=1 Tax=uncultured Sporomusa sp. TaxID=307249 RepID=A0A212LXX8_9FIRM|nr:hypothetical protein [uncultured Sporomusa sp.]SCM82454.1 hypothetical protein KL86SPO_50225 [uncultured Sporomusa sp.]